MTRSCSTVMHVSQKRCSCGRPTESKFFITIQQCESIRIDFPITSKDECIIAIHSDQRNYPRNSCNRATYRTEIGRKSSAIHRWSIFSFLQMTPAPIHNWFSCLSAGLMKTLTKWLTAAVLWCRMVLFIWLSRECTRLTSRVGYKNSHRTKNESALQARSYGRVLWYRQ